MRYSARYDTCRESHSAVLDPQRQQLLIFGGNSSPDGETDAEDQADPDSNIDHPIMYLNDLWALQLETSTWKRLISCAQVGSSRVFGVHLPYIC